MIHDDDAAVRARLPGTKHKVIGLVSGGKDSTFNLLHCVANGHEVVALATLTPEPGVDELDSHLYQSVGTTLLPLLARAMDLPLFTRVIKGKAVAKGAEYGSRSSSGEGSEVGGDETEDLYGLLREIKIAHPEATALASGAILSSYQRLRIEHVCSRLGLTSISYLWQAEQLPLLDRMLACGMEVVLMKVAGVGLGVDSVGKTLREVRPLLGRLERQYGSHPAGEGGEYETLTLTTPLFSHRLKLNTTEVIVTDPEPYPVAYLKVLDAELVPKEGWIKPGISELRSMLGLDDGQEGEEGLDEVGKEAMDELSEWDRRRKAEGVTKELHDLRLDPGAEERDSVHEIGASTSDERVRFCKQGRWLAVSISSRTTPEETIADELKRCFDAISEILSSQSLSLPLHTAHITLLLPSMSLFAPANAIYASYFGTSPPSRATVAVPLRGGRVVLEVVGFDDRPQSTRISADSNEMDEMREAHGDETDQADRPERRIGGRQALHVQGLSYWAPANIGPYSQAVIVNSHVHIAGQIPLIPASLTLPSPTATESTSPYLHQATLALQHVRKVRDLLRSKQSTGGGWEGWCQSAVGWWVEETEAGSGSDTAPRRQSDLGATVPSATAVGTESRRSRAAAAEVVRKAWEIWAEQNECQDAPIVFLQASELPRGALVEFQVNYHTGRRGESSRSAIDHVTPSRPADTRKDESDDDDDEELEAVHVRSGDGELSWEVCTTSSAGQGGRGVVFIRDLKSQTWKDVPHLTRHLQQPIGIKAYHLSSVSASSVEEVIRHLWAGASPCITPIPVKNILDRHGPRAMIALEVFIA